MSWTKKLGALVLAAGTLAGGATASRAAALTPGDQSLIPHSCLHGQWQYRKAERSPGGRSQKRPDHQRDQG